MTMDYTGPTSKSGIRLSLTITLDRGTYNVSLAGVPIGKIVTFGKLVSTNSRNGERKTVYASRINWNGIRVEVEGTKPSSLLEKVASKLAAGLKAKSKAMDVDMVPDDVGPAPKI